ncbi:hypothetical protein C0Q70_10205 [Pomacea canaliculata]|uniref:Uncharacterized protein n=1 Tax=Pomacea canaliculata TaxID=400727 RepID=A0A2T7PBZ4_POMCA|nr:hypothetical protein C0Q70_10205 [Pomacea canaliculata]
MHRVKLARNLALRMPSFRSNVTTSTSTERDVGIRGKFSGSYPVIANILRQLQASWLTRKSSTSLSVTSDYRLLDFLDETSTGQATIANEAQQPCAALLWVRDGVAEVRTSCQNHCLQPGVTEREEVLASPLPQASRRQWWDAARRCSNANSALCCAAAAAPPFAVGAHVCYLLLLVGNIPG